MKDFLIIGKTGVGKSSLINSLFGSYICKVSDFEACTKIVEYHAYSSPYGNVRLIDTPGLCDEDYVTDMKYISLIKNKVNIYSLDSAVYVTRIDDTRFRADEKQALKSLTLNLGGYLWGNAMLFFTFASKVDNPTYIAKYKTKQIVEFIKSICMENNIYPNFSSVNIIDNYDNSWCKNDAKSITEAFR